MIPFASFFSYHYPSIINNLRIMTATANDHEISRGTKSVRHSSLATRRTGGQNLRPTIVVPLGQADLPSEAHETAAALELAKHKIDRQDATGNFSEPTTPPETDVTDSYAFAFDIDGVLVRGGRAIPEAIEAMKVLNGQNELGIKMYVPTNPAFVMNGIDYNQTLHILNQWWGQDRAREMCGPKSPVTARNITRSIHMRSHPNARDGRKVRHCACSWW